MAVARFNLLDFPGNFKNCFRLHRKKVKSWLLASCWIFIYIYVNPNPNPTPNPCIYIYIYIYKNEGLQEWTFTRMCFFWVYIYTGCPKKKYPDLVDPSDKNIAWIKPKWFSKHTSIANLNIDTSFVEFSALRVKISIFKGQICLHLQTRALALWPKGILEAL